MNFDLIYFIWMVNVCSKVHNPGNHVQTGRNTKRSIFEVGSAQGFAQQPKRQSRYCLTAQICDAATKQSRTGT